MLRRMKNFLAGLSLVALLLVAPPALAEEEATQTKTTWYGWQTLIVDGGAIAAGLVTGNAAVLVGGMTLGAPIVHWAHGNVLTGFGSLGLRIGVPLLTTVSASLVMSNREVTNGHESEEALSIGILAGGLFASIFDAAVLARESTTVTPRRPAAASHWHVEPRVGVARGGASAGVGGTF
jgi:hypothetical protein